MKVTAARKTLSEVDEDVLIVPVFEGETPGEGVLANLDHLTGGAVRPLFENREVTGKRDQWAMLYHTGTLATRRVLLYGAGRREKTDFISLQRLSGAAGRILATRGASSAAFLLRETPGVDVSARAVVEGLILSQMNGDLYKTKDDEQRREIESLALISESPTAEDYTGAIRTGQVMAEATNLARTLCYEPGNVLTPSELANRAKEMAEREGLGVEVLDKEEMKRLGMGALLAVARGSAEPARLVVLTYEPEPRGDRRPRAELIALVGKGITFDSGGISIKPALNMEEMKYDMCGGAAVIGAMQVIARLKPAVRVIGVVAASENLPSGRAVKPGDVVRSMSGKTIEVVNTDAEGRMVLADAISHAISLGATHIVDAATLTGAVSIALGDIRAAVVGTDQQLVDDLVRAGEECGERLWQLPLDKEYGDMIRSDIADLKNVGDRTAGVITAAMFLKSFSGSVPWAHLDIAGTAWSEQAKPYLAKGATGFGVRVMSSFVLNRAQRPE